MHDRQAVSDALILVVCTASARLLLPAALHSSSSAVAALPSLRSSKE